MTILEDEIVNNKAFEHASLIVTEPWSLKGDWDVRFKFHFQILA